MNLFMLLLVLAVRRLDIGWTKSWVADDRVQRRLAPIMRWGEGKSKSLVWLLAVLVPVVLWVWLKSALPVGLSYVAEAVLLLWLLGAESEFRYLTGLIQRIRMRDIAQLEAQARLHFGVQITTEDKSYLDKLSHSALMKSAEGTFAVLFWFFLCGTWGSLFYALNYALAQSQERGSLAELLHKLLVWLPQRLLLVAMALAGSFRGATDNSARYWWQLDGQALLLAAIPDGLDLPRNMPATFLEQAKVQLIALEGLLNRCLALWLIVGVLWWALFQ